MKYISIRAYSRKKGVSDTAVHKAIKAGHIHESALNIVNGVKKGINPELADQQWSNTVNVAQSRKPEIHKTTQPAPQPRQEQLPQSGGISTAKAQQVEAVFKAKLRELDYKKKSGELINKDATYRALFAIGQEIRSSLQAIPDRIIDEVLAAPTRNDAHIVLTREIHDVLSRLVTIEKTGLLEGL